MAKKRFTDAFDSLFGDPVEEVRPKAEGMEPGKQSKETTSSRSKEKGKKSSNKNFADSLQSFLSESFEESFERQMAESQKRDASKPLPRKPKRRRSGLDMLIRSTVEPEKVEIEDRPKRRRITLTFEPKKLEKLRDIAKVERAMLKDIINEIVGDYIQKYEMEKGKE